MSMTYLFPTDGSEIAREVEDTLIQTTSPDHDRIVMIGVVDASQIVAGYEMTSEEHSEILDTERLLDEMELKTEQHVSVSADRLRDKGYEVDTEIVRGEPGEEICRSAEEHDVDIIAMGRHGSSQLTEVLLGSVSSYVVHHADRPVLLVPG